MNIALFKTLLFTLQLLCLMINCMPQSNHTKVAIWPLAICFLSCFRPLHTLVCVFSSLRRMTEMRLYLHAGGGIFYQSVSLRTLSLSLSLF